MAETLPRILCVDDEPYLLSALQRILSARFEIITAEGGAAGLDMVQTQGPFEAVMSDMRMPGMDGATFLARVRAVAPDTVRILLTGHADVEAAVAAINQGAIFRYLTKPCPREVLLQTLDEAVLEHRLVQAERELLATTLAAAVKTLTDVLAMAAPGGFKRGSVAQACARHALKTLGWSDPWQYEVAASLSQIGCLGLPQDMVDNHVSQRRLTAEESELMAGHPEIGYRLLAGIPRLEPIAEMVRYQAAPPPAGVSPDIARGAELLRAALALEHHVARGIAPERVMSVLRDVRPPINEDILLALADFRGDFSETRTALMRELTPGWILDEDIRTHNRVLVMSKGQEITEAAVLALRRMHAAHAVEEPVRVRYQTGNAR